MNKNYIVGDKLYFKIECSSIESQDIFEHKQDFNSVMKKITHKTMLKYCDMFTFYKEYNVIDIQKYEIQGNEYIYIKVKNDNNIVIFIPINTIQEIFYNIKEYRAVKIEKINQKCFEI